MKRILRWGLVIGLIAVVGIGLGSGTYVYTQVKQFNELFAPNVFIETIDVGGLTKEEARAKVEAAIDEELQQRKLVITGGSEDVVIDLKALGMTSNLEEVLEEAFKVGHEGNMLDTYRYFRNTEELPRTFEMNAGFDEALLVKVLESQASKFKLEPQNATMIRKNKQFIIQKEANGHQLDVQETAKEALKQLEDKQDQVITVGAQFIDVKAQYTEEDFKASQNAIASFATSYNNADPNRNENLAVAAANISRVLYPDEVFLLSEQLEPITYEAGYRSSKVIVQGKLEEGIGGGVCQVASTLYNAVLLTELEIVQRQNHSLAVSYVPLGRDATYATDVIDFKFKNNTGYPILIDSYCENNQVYVNIYGHETAKSPYEIKFTSELIEVIPPPETKYIEDDTLSEGTEIIETTALEGKRVKLYKMRYKDGQLVDKVVENTSTYRARAAVIRRGSKKETQENTPATAAIAPSANATEAPSTPTAPVEEIPMSEWDDSVAFEVIQN